MFVVTPLVLCLIFGTHAKELSKCDKLVSLASWRDRNSIVETSLKTLAGTWISEGCETRPGPEYALRSYFFDAEGHYKLIQHHYWDDSCSSPKLTLIAQGRIQLRNSLIQPKAANGIAKHTNITIIPQDLKAAQELDSLVSHHCPTQAWKSHRPNEELLVYDNRQERRPNFNLWSQYYQPISSNHHGGNKPGVVQTTGDIACLGPLKWAFNELKLVKIQFRPIMQRTPARNAAGRRQVEMELLLGDIHSNQKKQEFYSPTSFQIALIRQTKGENVTVHKHNLHVKSSSAMPTNLLSNMKTPPHLIEKPHLPPYIWGEWTSTRCEIRPQDVYLMRRFSLNENHFGWIGEHKFYGDPFCIHLKFIVTATGHFTLPGPSEQLKGTTNIDFQIESATLTAMDENVIIDMRLQGFCGYGTWRANEPKNLGPTNGCIHLGLYIPSIRYDVVKVEMDYKGSWLLFMGQADTNNMPTTVNERPTAFELPLVKCGETDVYSISFSGLLERNFFYSFGEKVAPNLLLVTILLVFCLRR